MYPPFSKKSIYIQDAIQLSVELFTLADIRQCQRVFEEYI